jgi:hypothetical protein
MRGKIDELRADAAFLPDRKHGSQKYFVALGTALIIVIGRRILGHKFPSGNLLPPGRTMA